MTAEDKNLYEVIIATVTLIVLIVTAFYVATAPLRAVKLGRQLNDEQNKDNAKRNLFLTLYSYRGLPAHPYFVDALNRIDVLFHDYPKVILAWQTLHNSLQLPEGATESKLDRERWQLQRATLLDEMATALGYSGLKQVDMLKYYFPQKHVDYENLEYDLKEAELLYHRSAIDFYARVTKNMDEAQQEKKEETLPSKQP